MEAPDTVTEALAFLAAEGSKEQELIPARRFESAAIRNALRYREWSDGATLFNEIVFSASRRTLSTIQSTAASSASRSSRAHRKPGTLAPHTSHRDCDRSY